MHTKKRAAAKSFMIPCFLVHLLSLTIFDSSCFSLSTLFFFFIFRTFFVIKIERKEKKNSSTHSESFSKCNVMFSITVYVTSIQQHAIWDGTVYQKEEGVRESLHQKPTNQSLCLTMYWRRAHANVLSNKF